MHTQYKITNNRSSLSNPFNQINQELLNQFKGLLAELKLITTLLMDNLKNPIYNKKKPKAFTFFEQVSSPMSHAQSNVDGLDSTQLYGCELFVSQEYQ